MSEESELMSLEPYRTPMDAQKIIQNNPTDTKFSPSSFVNHTSAYSAAYTYFANFCKSAVFLFENVSREYCGGKPVKDEDLPEIAKKMYEKSNLINDKNKEKWLTHLTQIMNARKGGGDPLSGYLKGFDPSTA